MTLTYHEDSSGKYWCAASGKGGYDGAGATVEAAMANLVLMMEQALEETETD